MSTRLILIITLALIPLFAHAGRWSLEDAKRHPRTFWSGVATGIAIHEACHVAMATSRGMEVHLEGASIAYDGAYDTRDHLLASAAGFQGQWLAAELILLHAETADDEVATFDAGIVCGHLLITAAYLLALKDHPDSDLTGIAGDTCWSRDTLAAYIALPALCDWWRLTGDDVPTWVPALSLSAKGAGAGMVWSF